MVDNQQQINKHGFIYNIREFICGSIAGFVQIMIGNPFDTIKVRIQTGQCSGTMQCITDLIKNEGPFAFYKGVASPLVGNMGVISICFGVYENSKKAFKHFLNTDILPISAHAVSGALAGFACSLILGPVELFRIRMQIYSSTFDCVKKIHKQFGMKGVYKGWLATALRESFANAVYFAWYETLMRRFRLIYKDRPTILKYMPLVAGGSAGLMFWLSIYPLDSIKTILQSDNFSQPKYKGIIDCFLQVKKTQGYGQLLQGLGVCAMRSVPVNAGSWLVYEEVLKIFEGRNH